MQIGLLFISSSGHTRTKSYSVSPNKYYVYLTLSSLRNESLDLNDQIGRSSKFLVTIFLIKVAQICGNFLGYFKKISQSLVKLLSAHRLGKLWQLFIITTSFKKLEHPNYYTLALNVIFQTFGTFFGATLSSIPAEWKSRSLFLGKC